MASWKVLAWPHPPVCVNLTFSLFLHFSHSDVYKLKELWWGLDGDLKNGRWITHSAGVPLLVGRAGGEELAAVTTFPATTFKGAEENIQGELEQPQRKRLELGL